MSFWTIEGPLGLLIDAVLKGTLFLLALFLLTPALRRLSAGSRHLIWGAGLLALLALPALSKLMPWRIGVLPAVAAAPAPAAENGGQVPFPQSHRGEASGEPAPAGTPEQSATPASTPSAAERVTAFALDWGVFALLVWGAGVLVMLIRLYVAQRSATALARSGRPVEGEAWEDAREWAAAHLDLDPTPAVMMTELLPLPVTTGFRRPVVLLPVEAEEWTAARRESVLLHEMAHIRRGDLLTHLGARLVCALWWFHPLAWRALVRFRAESERAADDLVLAAGRRASEYAQDLLAVVQEAGKSRAPMHALAMAQRSDFEGRLLAILEPGASRRGVTPMTAVPVLLGVSLIALPFAALGPAQAVIPEAPVAAIAPTVMAAPTPPIAPVTSTLELGQGARGVTTSPMPTPTPSPSTSVSVRTSTQVTVNVATIRALTEALADPVADVRMEAAHSLGQIGDTTVVSALSQALASDTDDGVRRAAAWALGELESSAAVPALVTALRRDRDIEVRRNCAWALGQIEDASAVDALGAVLGDPDAELREKAVWALGQIESARAVPLLIPVLRDASPEARSQAAWALGQIESKDATEALGRAASDSSREVRSHVAWALGQIEDPASVPALSRLLRDPVADVRKQAAWALGQVESAASVGALSQALSDSDAEVRSQAAWALGQIEDPASAAALETALRDQNADVRKHAAWALGQIELRRIPPGLIGAFDDADAEVRQTAAWAAGQIEDPAAIPGLTKLLADADRDVQKNALWALGQFDDPRALEGVTRLLRSNDAELRRMAAEALGRDH